VIERIDPIGDRPAVTAVELRRLTPVERETERRRREEARKRRRPRPAPEASEPGHLDVRG
jgi:hypothetical protein